LFCNGITTKWGFKDIIESWKELEEYLEKDIEPPKDFDINDKKEGFHCKYCDYTEMCWGKKK